MATLKFAGIIATMEEMAQEELMTAPEDDVIATETEGALTEGIVDVDTAEGDVEAGDTAMVDAEQAEDQIAELTEVAEDSLAGDGEEVAEGEVGEQGEGMTQGEAAVVEITHESIMKRLGFPVEHRSVLTVENFGKAENNRVATLEALDKLKASASAIGKGLVEALKSALKNVLGFLAGLFKNRDLMRRHMSNLHAQLKNLEGGQKAKETITAGAAALSVEGKASVQSAELLLAQASKMLAVCDAAATAMASPGMDMSRVATGTYHMANGRDLTVTADEGGLKFDVKDTGKATEIPAPDINQMRGLLNRALGTLKDLSKFEATQNKIRSAVQGIIDRVSKFGGQVVDKVREKTGAGPLDEGAAAARETKEQARQARAIMAKIGGTMPSAVFAAVKGVADYVKGGIANYQKQAPAEPAAAAA